MNAAGLRSSVDLIYGAPGESLGYWRNVDWAGLGPGAHSHVNAGTDANGGVRKALRAWDIAHPRMWGTAINEGRVPWGGSEEIDAGENLEELIMLGLRLREGLVTLVRGGDDSADGGSGFQ